MYKGLNLRIRFSKCRVYIMIIPGHALERLRQRGLRESDVEFILNNGTIRRKKAMLTNQRRGQVDRASKKDNRYRE